MTTIEWVSLLLAILGSLNLGIMGLTGQDLVSIVFGNATLESRLIFALIGIATIRLIITALTKLPHCTFGLIRNTHSYKLPKSALPTQNQTPTHDP